MDRWQEFLPMASISLRSTFARAACGRAPFSAAERALFTVCDFWAAVCTRRLGAYLSPTPLDTLRYLSILYAGIGAAGVVGEMIAIIGDLERCAHPQEVEYRVTELQERLRRTPDPVDQLIARLADTLGLASDNRSKHIFAPPAVALSA